MGVQVRLLDVDGNPAPHDGETVGELCFRSPAMAAGYHARPEASARSMRDGWYHSGDLGRIDPDGYVSVVERRTDLIVSGGMNVYPSEVEHCIAELAGVAEVAVIGVPHERWGQTVCAVVVRTPGAALTEAEVVAHCKRRIAGFKKPTAVLFADALPRTAGLKIARAELRDRTVAALTRA
jgi:fatty-acyl-CoA synthase